MIKPPDQEVKKIRQSTLFYKNRHPHKNKYYLYTLKHVQQKGMWLEFGVWTGTSINLIAKIMHLYRLENEFIYGFDSFEGLPEDWIDPITGLIQAEGQKGHFDLEGKFPKKDSENIVYIKGWFEDVLPDFAEKHQRPIAMLHIDSDLYSSAKTIFDHLGDRLIPGSIIMFDEFYNYEGFEAHEYKAFKEFVEKYNVSYRWISHIADQRQASLIIEDINI